MNCPHCGFNVTPRLEWQRFSNRTLHIRAVCSRPECGRFIRYVEQTPGNMTGAGDPPAGESVGPSLFEEE